MRKFLFLLLTLAPFKGHPHTSINSYEKRIQGNQILTIRTINEISEETLYAPSDSLIILGIENTLLQGAEAISHKEWLENTLLELYQIGLSQQEAFELAYPRWIEHQKRGSVKLIEQEMKTLITFLRQKDLFTIGCSTKGLKHQDLLQSQLDSLAISFSPTVSQEIQDNSNSSINKICGKQGLHNGILFLSESPSQELFQQLFEILQKSRSRPFSQVIFINEDEHIIKLASQTFSSLQIPFLGAVYTKILFSPRVYSPQIAKIQYQLSQKILSNEAAALLLRHNILE